MVSNHLPMGILDMHYAYMYVDEIYCLLPNIYCTLNKGMIAYALHQSNLESIIVDLQQAS